MYKLLQKYFNPKYRKEQAYIKYSVYSVFSILRQQGKKKVDS